MRAGTGTSAHPHSERGNDLYETPPEAVWALLRYENLPMTIWEPACGPGAIVRVLREAGHNVIATDLIDYGWPDGFRAEGDVHFLAQTNDDVPPYQAIVTNPPFKFAAEFVAQARKLCPYVVMLLRLAFYESERRTPILDGGDLARILVFRKRLPMMHRAGWEGRKANSGMAFAWYIWDRSHKGPTQIRRISWERLEDNDPVQIAPRPFSQTPIEQFLEANP